VEDEQIFVICGDGEACIGPAFRTLEEVEQYLKRLLPGFRLELRQEPTGFDLFYRYTFVQITTGAEIVWSAREITLMDFADDHDD